jgi:hypothetical protein
MPSGSVSRANTRLSVAPGFAFFDASGPFLNYPDAILTVTSNSTGKKVVGFIKLPGTGETYGSNLLNADFADGSNWTPSGVGAANWVIAGGVATWTGGGGSGYLLDNSVTPTVGGCYLQGYKINSIAGGANHQVEMGGVGMAYVAAAGTYSRYFTAIATTKYKVYAADAQTSLVVDDMVGKQILTPSVAGVTIHNGAGDQNWASIESGFNYNDTNGYTYTLVRRNSRIGRPSVPRVFQR